MAQIYVNDQLFIDFRDKASNKSFSVECPLISSSRISTNYQKHVTIPSSFNIKASNILSV